MSPRLRSMVGVLSVLLYAGVAAWALDRMPWLAGAAAALGLLRLVLLVRQLTRGFSRRGDR